MSFSTSDLTPLLLPPKTNDHVRYGQGIIREWNPETFENQIDFRGVSLFNLPVRSGVEALTYQPGDVVALEGWAPGGGFGSWWITGRIVTPGAGRGAETVAFMTTSLARALAGELLHSNHVETAQNRDTDTFGDLSTVGPSVTVEVTSRALVTLSARIQPNANNTAYMGFQITGATSLAASVLRAVGAGAVSDSVTVAASRTVLVEGLNPGTHTFTAKYASINFANAFWSNRVITVHPF